MKPEIKKLWVDALRSGNYRQGSGALRQVMPDGDAFCCLGVLCDISKVGEWEKQDSFSSYFYSHEFSSLPHEVCKWAGLSATNPTIGKFSCVGANDSHRLTFPQIADLIEENL